MIFAKLNFSVYVLAIIWMQMVACDSGGWLTNSLNELSDILKNGNPSAGIPKLDPFHLQTDLYTNSTMFRGNITFDGELSGFSNYYVKNATLDPDLNLLLKLIFISTTLEGKYFLEGDAYKGIIPLSGGGPLNIYFSFIEVDFKGTIVGKNQMLQLSDFDFQINQINAVLVNVGGLLEKYGLGDVLKSSLRSFLNTGIKLFKPKLEDVITQVVRTDGNQALRQVNIGWILRQLKGKLVLKQGHFTSV